MHAIATPSFSTKPAPGEWLYVALSALALVGSVVKAPFFPSDDPALFEYYGWAMLHGQRLYADLLDVKPASIYLGHELWQWLFGENYALHTYAEAAVAAATIALFALLLRRWKIRAWALGTFLFAAFFMLPLREFDYAEQYAVFFIVLGLYLSARGSNFFGGAAIALGTTFWPPAVLTTIPILVQPIARRERLLLGAGFVATVVLYLVVSLAAFGPQFFADLGEVWAERATARGYMGPFRIVGLPYGPAIAALGLMVVLAVRRPVGDASRFALIWSACALAGTAVPPNFFENYFVPSPPAFAMAIASFGFSIGDVVRRPMMARIAAFVVVLAAAGLIVIAVQRVASLRTMLIAFETNYVVVGHWIRSSLGSGATSLSDEYLPEVYLAAHARMPYHSSLLLFSAERGTWRSDPQALIFGPHHTPAFTQAQKPLAATLHGGLIFDPACPGRTGTLVLYASHDSVAALRCTSYQLLFGSQR